MYILGFVHTGIEVFEQFCNELHRQCLLHITSPPQQGQTPPGLLEQSVLQANELSDVCHTHSLIMKEVEGTSNFSTELSAKNCTIQKVELQSCKYLCLIRQI